MNYRVFIYLFLFLIPIKESYGLSISLPLQLDSWGKAKNTEWNGTTPLALDITNGENYRLFVILPDKTRIELSKSIDKDFENKEQYVFNLDTPYILNKYENFVLEVKNTKKIWPFNTKKTKITHKTNTPTLSLISSSEKVTHGGAGLVVVNSEAFEDLSFLAVIDEKNIPFYPKRFLKDSFYAILFSWYTDHSQEWSNQYVLAMDNAGNTNKMLIDTKATQRKYRESTIKLPKDYAQQKAKELALSQEKASNLEGNIEEINKVLAAQRTFSRWEATRTTFKKNAETIIKDTNVFSVPAKPMKQAITTATYGDRRKYYYQGNMVRQSIHRGLDYASFKNVPIYALLDGVVVYSDWYGGNGKSVVIDHGFNTYTLYAHNSELMVEEGQKVKAGDQISISGTTGQSTGDHLHISVVIQGMFAEPKEWTTKESIDTLFHQPLIAAQEYINSI